jgi:hypothetical protein
MGNRWIDPTKPGRVPPDSDHHLVDIFALGHRRNALSGRAQLGHCAERHAGLRQALDGRRHRGAAALSSQRVAVRLIGEASDVLRKVRLHVEHQCFHLDAAVRQRRKVIDRSQGHLRNIHGYQDLQGFSFRLSAWSSA